MKKLRWNILFEDEAIIVVDKPAPFLTIPDRYDRTIPNVHGVLLASREDVFINHRLDKETSGLLVFTKTEEAHKALSNQFESRLVQKYYFAIVNGIPAEEVGLIDLPIGQNKTKRKGMLVDAKGKESLTKYRVLDSWRDNAFLEIDLLTGRQHQIRVHMKSIFCPVVCDDLYGDGQAFYLSKIKRKMKRNKNVVERPLLSRVALHAHKLIFKHPIKGDEMQFESPLPKDMKAVIAQLNKCS